MHRFILPLCFLGLLLGTFPAHAFFENLDGLGDALAPQEEEFNVEDLIKQLEDAAAPPPVDTPTYVPPPSEPLPPATEYEGEQGNEIPLSESTFHDVPAGAWFHSYVETVANAGIAGGYKNASGQSTGYFGPGDPVTIAQMLKMALRAAGADETRCTNTPRHPQATGHWASNYIACAELLQMRILSTTPDVNRPARRGEVLGMIHDSFGDKVPLLKANFTDVSGHAYEADIAYAAQNAIVSGDTDSTGNPTGTYRPNDGVNRAEASKILTLKMQQ